MVDDPIVEDVYQARQKILDQCNGDLKKWMERLRVSQSEHADRVVSMEDVQENRRLRKSAS
ncbi:MAG: hypothetical protein DWQ34_26155 [Planctomycetota bacterium]|nr:MAG: hypothetical protein DWQ29_14250 [Planctomycetota bacterium]REJ86767.1 MAG: hypothetical protein DWQ34_26155 [Planctomycetota bacterium]REK23663.1 MAG: hypothetical protein DWQ41_16655 [Planctomycetota bacterium]REK31110.1 MAG: hypothetical protein DWQ45_19875 [Planctomycetota bacterium]